MKTHRHTKDIAKKCGLLCVGLLSLLMVSLRTTAQPKAHPAPLTALQQQNFDYYYYEALRQLNAGEVDEGFALLRHCHALDSCNAAVRAAMASVFAITDSLDAAIGHIATAVAYDPWNWEYRNDYVTLLAQQQRYAEAERALRAELKQDPWNDDAWRMEAALAALRGKYGTAIKALNRVERIKGISEATSIEKFKVYIAWRKEKKAVAEIDRLVAEYPAEYRYQVLRGQLYMGQGMPEKAYETYQHVLKKNPENPYVYISLAEYYRLQGRSTEALDQIMTALKSPHLDVSMKLSIYGQYIRSLADRKEKQEELERMLQSLVEQYPFEEQVHLYYALFLTRSGREEEALGEWRTMLDINPKNLNVWLQVFGMYAERNETELLFNATLEAEEALPTEAAILFYRALAQAELRQDEEAIATCEKGVSLCRDGQTELKSNLLMQQGALLHQTGDLEAAVEAYAEAYRLTPNNIMLLNNYAYFMAMTGKNLKQAERMSQKTLEADPQNAVYLDTYAWILYLQGSYSLAKFYMERAIDNRAPDDNSAEFWEHYGYILDKNGKPDEAIEAWRKAVEAGSENQEIIQIIETHNTHEEK